MYSVVFEFNCYFEAKDVFVVLVFCHHFSCTPCKMNTRNEILQIQGDISSVLLSWFQWTLQPVMSADILVGVRKSDFHPKYPHFYRYRSFFDYLTGNEGHGSIDSFADMENTRIRCAGRDIHPLDDLLLMPWFTFCIFEFLTNCQSA